VHQDRPSLTASYVAMGRALAHARRSPPAFDDPFALQLLPDDHREVVERMRKREWPKSRREAMLAMVASATQNLIGPRTVEIDQGLRELPSGHQLVLLGAGLDARAYRMRELSESIAFEVDHPATQGFKVQKARALRPCTRELRHVAVDFERDRLGEALERAGHDARLPTAWVFEGVVSYLTESEVAATFDIIAGRSYVGSRLLLTYNEPNVARRIASRITARTGEPQRAAFAPRAMRRLLEARGFIVRSDRDGVERARRWNRQSTVMDRLWVRFHHVLIADFIGSS